MRWLIFVTVVSLAGCSGIPGRLESAAEQAAQAEDAALVAATWTLCRAVSVGAWLRAYGKEPEKAQAWRVLCSAKVTEMPATEAPGN